MENASKALLIAGAILICIVLISVGMLVLNSTTDVTDQVGDITTSQAAQSFNSNYTGYAGTQKGSSVRQLLGAIATNNQTNNAGHTIKVTTSNIGTDITDVNDASDITAKMSDIVNSATYTVEITAMDAGYVSAIKISK